MSLSVASVTSVLTLRTNSSGMVRPTSTLPVTTTQYRDDAAPTRNVDLEES